MRHLLVILTALLPLAACRTTRTERLAPPSSGTVHRASPARAWHVVAEARGDLLGEVVLFEAPGEPEAAVYVVRNAWQQDLGMIDSLGRAWRYQPHQREAEWIVTGTVLDGAAAILGTDLSCRLDEVALRTVAAGPARL